MGKGVVTWDIEGDSYLVTMPDGRVERVEGFLRFAWLCACLIFRGYTVHERGNGFK